jgi:death on curing protein
MSTSPEDPSIRFLTRAEVLELHRLQLERFGGRPGVRDLGLLDSALGMPAAGVAGQLLHSDPTEKAAAVAFFRANARRRTE